MWLFGLGADLLSSLPLSVPRDIQRRLVNYALRKTLGPLVRRNLSSEDLDLQLKHGRLSFSNLDLRLDAINEQLHTSGLRMLNGHIALLEINVPWSDIVSGRMTVLIRGLKVVLEPLLDDRHREGANDPEELFESTANVAESFVDEDHTDDVGVGSEELSEPAMLQRLLDVILANLRVELFQVEIVLLSRETKSDVSVSLERLIYGPASDPSNKLLESIGMQVKLIDDNIRKHGQADLYNVSHHSTSSRSTSSSSFDDSELAQSTIFGRDEGRSLYMSAMSFPSMYHSAIAEDMEPDAEEGPAALRTSQTIASCPAGFTALLSTTDQGVKLDVSCQGIEILAGRSEITDFVLWLKVYLSNVPKRSETTVDKSGGTQLELAFRLSDISCSIDLDTSDDLVQRVLSGADGQPSLSFKLQQIVLSYGPANAALRIGQVELMVSGRPIFGPNKDMDEFIHVWTNLDGSIEGIVKPLSIEMDLEIVLVLLNRVQTLAAGIFPAVQHRMSMQSPAPQRPTSLKLRCSSIHSICRTEQESLSLILEQVVVWWTADIQRERLALELGAFRIAINDVIAVNSQTQGPHIIDFTSYPARRVQRTLEFINYEDLFENPERDYKQSHSTIEAVKQRAKAACRRMVRLSFDSIFISINRKTIDDVLRISENMRVMLQRELMALHRVDSPRSEEEIVAYFAEIQACDISLDADDHSFRAELRKCSSFGVINMKNIDAASMDILKLDLIAVDKQDSSTKIVGEGLHHKGSSASGLCPMISVKYRKTHLGKRAQSRIIRTEIHDALFEYYAQMPWLDTLRIFFSNIQSIGTHNELPPPNPVKTTFAVDLANVSIGLNPYITSTKALLYLRNSAMKTLVDDSVFDRTIKLHAGVADIFLIDDIEGGQNDLSDSKRVRKDPVTSALVRLGFVQVASVETVEISLKLVRKDPPINFCCQVHVAGAIFTLTTCADSTATLVGLINTLRLPVILNDELKYNLGLTSTGQIPMDVFESIEEDAYKMPHAFLYDSSTSSANKAEADRHAHHWETSISSADAHLDGSITDDYQTCRKAPYLQPTGEVVSFPDEEDESMLAMVEEHFLPQSVLELEHGHILPKNHERQTFVSVHAENCFVVWNVHDGYDWDKTRQEITRAVDLAVNKAHKSARQHDEWERASDDGQASEDDNSRSTDSNEVGDLLFNSIYIALPTGAKFEDLTKSINQELAQTHMSDSASQTTATVSKKTSVSEEESNQRLRLGRSAMHKVRIEASGICMSLVAVTADEGEVLNHLTLSIQDLEIIDNVSTSTWRKFLTYHRGAGSRENGSNMVNLDITTVKPVAGLAAAELIVRADVLPLRLHVDQDTLEFLTRFFEFRASNSSDLEAPAEEIFFQRFELQAIQVQIDYKPKRVDFKSLRSGRTTEFKNFFILEDSNMILKHVVLYGVCGLGRVFEHLNDIWLAHIKANQLGSVLAGVSPLRSLASFGGGIKKLVMVPMSEYQKNGTVAPGLKKGLAAFAKTTGSEAVRLGAKLAIGTQGFLESAETMLNNTGNTSGRTKIPHAVSLYANQPRDIRQGVSQAITGLTRNVATARNAITSLPQNLDQETDARGAAMVAVRSVPIAVIRPLIGTTEMISKTLLGLRNTMNPEQRKMNDDKYK